MFMPRNMIIRNLYRLWHALKRRDISDEYVNWVYFANAGMLDRGNLYALDYALDHLPSQAPILEIGSFCGLSTNLITYYKQRHSVTNPLITCDKWEFENVSADGRLGNSTIQHVDYRHLVRESYLRNVRLFSGHDLPRTVEMTSDEFFAAWKQASPTTDVFGAPLQLGGPLSFCYIDGNHSYEYARRDFMNCHTYLAPGGFILFDDSADGSGWDVCQVVKEVKASRQYEVVLKNPNYLVRKIAA
jgi:SAM-dependent methyltransferase